MRSPAVVGRDDEVALLRHLLDAAASGRGSVVLVTGEAGIGKSRLLQEAGELARQHGLHVLRGRAVETGGTYRPVAQALVSSLRGSPLATSEELRPYRAVLGRLLPDWSEVPTEAGGGQSGPVDPVLMMGEGLLRLLSSIGETAGALLLLEDLHWADPETLALVEYLAGAVHDWPVLVAASARDDWPGVAIQHLLGADDVTTLRLARLSQEEVGALASSRIGFTVPEPVRRLLVDRSDGVPLLVVELLAGLAERQGSFDRAGDGPPSSLMPRTFTDLVSQRLGLLKTDQRRVLAAAAVLGTDPDWSLLPQISEVSEAETLAAIRGAASAHLLVAGQGRLRWRHALTREAVLATVLPPERAALARTAAQALQARGGTDDEATAAELLSAAGEHDAAAAVLLRLAHRDLARGALRSAACLLARLTCVPAQQTALAIERVQLLTLQGVRRRRCSEVPGPLRRRPGTSTLSWRSVSPVPRSLQVVGPMRSGMSSAPVVRTTLRPRRCSPMLPTAPGGFRPRRCTPLLRSSERDVREGLTRCARRSSSRPRSTVSGTSPGLQQRSGGPHRWRPSMGSSRGELRRCSGSAPWSCSRRKPPRLCSRREGWPWTRACSPRSPRSMSSSPNTSFSPTGLGPRRLMASAFWTRGLGCA